MRTFGWHRNTAFNWNDQVFRIERINNDDGVLIERINDGQMSVVPQSLLLKEYAEGKLEANTESVYINQRVEKAFSRPLDELPEAIKLEAKRRRHYLDFIHTNGKPVFTEKYLKPLILEAAILINDTNMPHVTTIYRWYKKFSITQDTRSLLPRLDLRGSKIRKQKPIIYKILADVIEQAFKLSPQTTKVSIYYEFVWQIKHENSKLLSHEQLVIPSKRTVERLISSMEVYDLVSLKEGKRAAEKLFRMVKNKVITTHILERVEIDHTPLDLFLIDENTHLPLGRPTVTILIDHFSRMILGYFISYQNASLAAVMGAFRHAVLPKSPVKQYLPGLNIEYQWPCYGVPELIVLDNGFEFHSHSLESVAFDLGIAIQYCPKRTPEFKGVVERFIKTINYSFASQIPGASYSKYHLRKDYDPQKHALLTLGEFTHIFEKWVLDVYAQSLHRGLGTTPWAKWQQGLKSYGLRLPMSVKELKRRIGKVETRSLSNSGVLIKGIRYQNDALGSIVNAYGGKVRVRVLYDPQDLGEIQVWAPDSEAPITVPALKHEFANGLTEQQNNFKRARERNEGKLACNMEKVVDSNHAIRNTLQVLASSPHLKDRKRGAKLSGISSSNPQSGLLKNNETTLQDTQQKKKCPKNNPKNTDQPFKMPEILPTFVLNTKGGSK